MYQYQATVIKVHDGDTVHLDVKLGCDVTLRMTVRLAGINAPELSTPEGKLARDYLLSLMPADGGIWIATIKDRREKYGRYLGTLFLDRFSMEQSIRAYCVNDMMITAGHAVAYV